MADRLWFEKIRSLITGHAIIVGSFAPNGASALSSTSVRGKGFTVARTSAGLFTVTLADRYTKLLGGVAHLGLTTGDDKYAQIGDVDLSAKTVKIRVWDISGGAETDVAANANNRINFVLHLGTMSVD